MILFHNCIIQAPDGTNLSRCSFKKLKWYLRQGLATQISDNPPVIQLKFEPSGRAGAEDPYIMDGKPNHCIVCGSTENLTRHHVIPRCFIKHMGLERKVDIMRDIMPMCRDCHDRYEKFSDERKRTMATELNIPINGLDPESMGKIRRATRAAKALSANGDKIPEPRKSYLLDIVKCYLSKENPSNEEIEKLSNYSVKEHQDYVSFSKHVAGKVCDYDSFAKNWRHHFVECMNPKFLPDNWELDRESKVVWIPNLWKRRYARHHHPVF